MELRSGRKENLPYSLSRWTDVSGSQNKWEWFKVALAAGEMTAFGPRSAVPARWSLAPEETLGLVIWTKNPTNVLRDRTLVADYRVKIHITATGWIEVEKGAPDMHESSALIYETVRAFGAENVTWRFSPVPLVPDVVGRFNRIAHTASYIGLDRVYLSFLQANDLVPEMRSDEERLTLLGQLGEIGARRGIKVLLCNEDRLLTGGQAPRNVASGICAPPEAFAPPNLEKSPSEGCGCSLMVDPFTINESCAYGCHYCYASDKSLSDKKRNTTKGLPVIR
jgi:hypothetical protein